MIHMRVGNQNMTDTFAPHRVQQCRKMRFIIWSWINDRHTPASHNKCIRALEGEGAGVVASDSSDERRKLHRLTERRFKICVKFDFFHGTKVMVAPANQPN